MNFVYVEGWSGNGFEDAGGGVSDVKIFTVKSEALAYSGKKFLEFAEEYLGEDVEGMNVHEMAEQLNGCVDVDTGTWECHPESTVYGLIKEVA